jgi:hypothetical protein
MIDPFPIPPNMTQRIGPSRRLRSGGDGGGTKMQRRRMCRFLRHRRRIWRRDYVAQPAPSARSGRGIYSQQMNNLNRISTRHRYALNPNTHPNGTKAQFHLTYLSSVFSSVTVGYANIFQSFWTGASHYTASRCSSDLEGVEDSPIFDGFSQGFF